MILATLLCQSAEIRITDRVRYTLNLGLLWNNGMCILICGHRHEPDALSNCQSKRKLKQMCVVGIGI